MMIIMHVVGIVFSAILLIPFGSAEKKDTEETEIEILKYDNCPSTHMYGKRGINSLGMNIDFSGANIRLRPLNTTQGGTFTFPGCMRARIENVKFLKPVKDLVAEFDIRVGRKARLTLDELKANKGVDHQKVPCAKDAKKSCPCGDSQNTCLRCGFCDSVSKYGAEGNSLFIDTQRKGKADGKDGEGSCLCQESIKPGAYTITTDICTPTMEELEKNGPISDEITELLGDSSKSQPMWATIFFYSRAADKVEQSFRRAVRHFSDFTGRGNNRILEQVAHMRNERTIGCFLMFFQAKVLDTKPAAAAAPAPGPPAPAQPFKPISGINQLPTNNGDVLFIPKGANPSSIIRQ